MPTLNIDEANLILNIVIPKNKGNYYADADELDIIKDTYSSAGKFLGTFTLESENEEYKKFQYKAISKENMYNIQAELNSGNAELLSAFNEHKEFKNRSLNILNEIIEERGLKGIADGVAMYHKGKAAYGWTKICSDDNRVFLNLRRINPYTNRMDEVLDTSYHEVEHIWQKVENKRVPEYGIYDISNVSCIDDDMYYSLANPIEQDARIVGKTFGRRNGRKGFNLLLAVGGIDYLKQAEKYIKKMMINDKDLKFLHKDIAPTLPGKFTREAMKELIYDELKKQWNHIRLSDKYIDILVHNALGEFLEGNDSLRTSATNYISRLTKSIEYARKYPSFTSSMKKEFLERHEFNIFKRKNDSSYQEWPDSLSQHEETSLIKKKPNIQSKHKRKGKINSILSLSNMAYSIMSGNKRIATNQFSNLISFFSQHN